MTLMTYVRFHATGTNQAFMNICGAEDGFKLAMSGGALSFTNTESSITAGALTTAVMGLLVDQLIIWLGQHTIQLNRWYHVAGVVSATGSDSGMKIYVDGNRMQLARTSLIGNVGALTGSIPLSGFSFWFSRSK